ncbi:MAG: hypothetical protein JRE64_02535 [Deltaproteobacteria bacterium]|nr:hypothetical protein [Deltaproteobacteria bacterium]
MATKENSSNSEQSKKNQEQAQGSSEQPKNDYDQLIDLANKLKEAFEGKGLLNWKNLGNLQFVWVHDRAMTLKELATYYDKFLEQAKDVEFNVNEIKNVETVEGSGRLSVRVQLIWSDPETWEEKEWAFITHLGVTKVDGKFDLNYLGFTSDIPPMQEMETPVSQGMNYFTAGMTPELAMGYFSDAAPQGMDYFTSGISSFAEIPYFTSFRPFGVAPDVVERQPEEAKKETTDKESKTSGKPKMVVVHLPCVLPVDALEGIFRTLNDK